MTEEIIIDGVNVAGCERRIGKNNFCRYFRRNCADNNYNCIWKKCLRLEQENKELKAENERLKSENETLDYQWHKRSEIGDEWYKLAEKYKVALQEIKAIVCSNCEIIDTQGRKDILNLYKGINNKVVILGKLISKYNAPFEDMSYDIWTCNYNEPLPRVDQIFDIHSHGVNPKATVTRANYPFKEAEKLVGGQYFNNTFSYMIALAILLEYKEIELYGVRLYDDHEIREHQRQNVRELIFFARGRGIKVTAPADECLLEEYEYYGL